MVVSILIQNYKLLKMKISLILKNKTIIINYPINFTFCILQVFCTQPWHCIPVLQLISKNWWWRIWRSIRNLKRGTYDIICCISGTFCFLFKKFTCFWKGMHVSDDHINYANENFWNLFDHQGHLTNLISLTKSVMFLPSS